MVSFFKHQKDKKGTICSYACFANSVRFWKTDFFCFSSLRYCYQTFPCTCLRAPCYLLRDFCWILKTWMHRRYFEDILNFTFLPSEISCRAKVAPLRQMYIPMQYKQGFHLMFLHKELGFSYLLIYY